MSDLGTFNIKLERGSQVGHGHLIYGTKLMIQIMKPRQGGENRRGENSHCRQGAVSPDRDGNVLREWVIR